MRRRPSLAFIALALGLASSARSAPEDVVATFSIVAIDPDTGALGCAVQSRYFAVGAVVCWGEADVGVVATQANVNVGYGPKAVDLLRQGLSAGDVLARLLDEDTFPGKAGRQVAIVDARGGIAVHTGPEAMDWAGHRKGGTYTAQGNILAGPEVAEQMAKRFESASGSLAERLVAALEAGQEAGGDRRGRQSAALLVVQKGAGRNINNDVAVRLHVDDHPTPIQELKRLLNVQLAIGAMSESRRHLREGRIAEALAEAERAAKLWPDTSNTHMSVGLIAYQMGDEERALEAFERAKAHNPQFREQLESSLAWQGLDDFPDAFWKKLFPGGQ